jgi:hypothetical protein
VGESDKLYYRYVIQGHQTFTINARYEDFEAAFTIITSRICAVVDGQIFFFSNHCILKKKMTVKYPLLL